ncbi:MAG: hypothetical protein LBD59_00915 [Prevotellaceae bacterium]|jgi:hypothetical protein|nr:hypothetical protein [Prevotellaceae bacterium]
MPAADRLGQKVFINRWLQLIPSLTGRRLRGWACVFYQHSVPDGTGCVNEVDTHIVPDFMDRH